MHQPAILIAFACVFAFALSACARKPKPKYPVAEYTPAVLDGRQIRIVDTRGNYKSLVIEADWVFEGNRQCVRDGEVSLVTPAGTMTLYRTSACVTLAPFSMVGEAEVPFPGLGYLSRVGVSGNSPRGKIAIGLGHSVGTIEIDGEPMELNPNAFYLAVDYFSGLSATIGTVALSTPSAGARLVVSPQEPMLYVAGSLTGLIDDAGLGFSADGRLPFSPARPLYDGSRWSKQTFTGHILVHGSMPVPPYPLSVGGRLLINVDANGNGRTFFDGDGSDTLVAADGTVSVGYDKAGFGFSVAVGNASLTFDSHRRTASFSAEASNALFDGTPLAFLSKDSSKATVRGYYHSETEFEVTALFKSSMLAGFAMAKTILRLGNSGISIGGKITMPGIGAATLVGDLQSDGKFDLRGRADVTVAGFRLVQADVAVGNSGLTIAGLVKLPALGVANLFGKVHPNGQFTLSGRATLRPAGLKLSNASVKLSPKGAAIAGSVSFAGARFKVAGRAKPRSFSLTGSLRVSTKLIKGRVALSIGNRGAKAEITGSACLARKCVDLPGVELDTKGRICPTFPVTGRKCIKVFGNSTSGRRR